ncbi:MAG: Gfo/Idh/MocA family oxidoreductase [Mycobacterium sp.]
MTEKLLVMGTGRMAHVRAEAARAAAPDMDVHITGRRMDRVREMASQLGMQPVAIAELNEHRYAGTFITSATDNHLEDLKVSLALGVPVLCEKPLAARSADAAVLAAAANAAGVPLYVGFQRRFDFGYRGIRERIDGGKVGPLHLIRTTSFDHRPSAPEFLATSGGIFLDLLVHDVDIVHWLAGSVVDSVYASATVRTSPIFTELDDFDVVTAVLNLRGGVTAVLNATRSNPHGQDVRCEVLGADESVAAGLGTRTPIHRLDWHGGPGPTAYPDNFMDRFADAFTAETAAFVDHVRGGGAFTGCTADECLRAMIVAERCEQSARTSRWLPVDPM